MSDTPAAAAVFESMTLLAALSTASDVHQGVQERRAGNDPTAQEPVEVALARLQRVRDPFCDAALYLMRSTVPQAAANDELATVVRHFDERMNVYRLGQWAHDIHQALLSLYPRVSEALVEEARGLSDIALALAEAPTSVFIDELYVVAQHALSLITWVEQEVSL